jgi:hypothetical protein
MRTLTEHRVDRSKLKGPSARAACRTWSLPLGSLHFRRPQRVVKNGLGVGAASRNGRSTRDTSAFQPPSPDPRQLERRHGGIDADIEAKDVQLEPLVDSEEEARKTVERNLKPEPLGAEARARQSPDAAAERARQFSTMKELLTAAELGTS